MRLPRVLARLLVLVGLLLSPPSAQSQSNDVGLERLRTEIQRLSTAARGKVGVGLIHLESGRELFVNGDEGFPMASTVKVPIAVQLLTRVDRRQVRLDSMITVQASDLHPGSGTLSNLFDDPGVVLSLRNLTELMLLISDNSATDIVLRSAGGGSAVNERLAALGVTGISANRSTIQLIADAIGVTDLGPESAWTLSGFAAKARQVSPEASKAAATAFYRDPRDTATPLGMARLLQKLWKGEALSRPNTDLLLDIMLRCETGAMRIKGLLPPGTDVRHKTGSLGIGVANDVGIVTLPDGAGHVVMTIFVKESLVDAVAQERVIAQVARAAYDYFLFTSK
ncbi:MAG: class A beta-lactamase [Gemmatimonadaceae bacterium]|nr:class A beta-lactamase [Gemmatimonadaceae bacterium]